MLLSSICIRFLVDVVSTALHVKKFFLYLTPACRRYRASFWVIGWNIVISLKDTIYKRQSNGYILAIHQL